MLKVNVASLSNIQNTLDVVVHVGDLETLVKINFDSLSTRSKDLISALIQQHLNGLPTSEVLALLK